MNLLLDFEQHYVVEDILDHRGFVDALHLLLRPTDIVVFGTYGSRPDIHAFLSAHQITPDIFVLSARRHFEIWKEEYPDGTAFGLPADPVILSRLVALLGPESDPTDLCDHIVAYSAEFPILCFHDAFKSDPCYISSRLPLMKVEAFCDSIDRAFSLRPIPETLT